MKWDTAGKPKKPLIVGIGAQKAGTTWLSQMLSQHPQVWAPPFKEVQYFNYHYIPEHRKWLPWHFRRARINQEKRYTSMGMPMPPELDSWLDRITRGEMFTKHWYKQVFAPAPEGTVPCDITPEYSTLPEEGIDEVGSFLPKAKFIYIIRHPVDRIISQLKMNLTRAGRRPKSVEDWMVEIEDPVLYDRGDYQTYVPRWTERFDEERLLIMPFGAISATPAKFLRMVEAHFELEPFSYRNMKKKVFAANDALSCPDEVRAELRRRLEPQFQYLQETFPEEFVNQIR